MTTQDWTLVDVSVPGGPREPRLPPRDAPVECLTTDGAVVLAAYQPVGSAARGSAWARVADGKGLSVRAWRPTPKPEPTP
jgi:hypothetical protein